MSDLVRVNRTILSWESCSLLIALVPYNGIRSIDFDGEERTREPVKGMRRDGVPLGKPSGDYKPGTIKLVTLRDTAWQIMQQLTVLGAGSFGDAEFTLQFQASEPVPSLVGPPVQTITAEGCTISKPKESQEVETKFLVTEFEIQPMSLTRNGMRLWSLVRSI